MGADLRILVARALNSSDLSPSDLRETDVDRIGAVAFADPLGGALWALKWGGDARAYAKALDELTRRSRRVCLNLERRENLCRVALEEWLDDLCRRCGGRGTQVATTIAPARTCHVCEGSGKRQISEVWRARKLGLERNEYRKWESRYDAVQRRIVDAEWRAWRDIARQLERRGVRA